MLDDLDQELAEIGIDRRKLLQGIAEEATERLEKSIEAGRRVAERRGTVEPAGVGAGSGTDP